LTDTPSNFEIETDRVDGARIVRVRGELDLGTYEQLGELLVAEAGDGEPLIVDLSECGFIDSSGIRALLIGRRASDEADGGALSIAGPSPQVLRTLEMTGLNGAIPVHASVEEALAATG
jgi:anti-anti-sigma factor